MKPFLFCLTLLLATEVAVTAHAQRSTRFSFPEEDSIPIHSMDSDAENWTPQGGSLSDDDQDFNEGSGSLLFVSGASFFFSRPEPAVDWTGMLLAVDVKVDDLDAIQSLGIGLILSNDEAPSGTLPDSWTRWTVPKVDLVEGQWQTLVFDLEAQPEVIIERFLRLDEVLWLALQPLVEANATAVVRWDHLRLVPKSGATQFKGFGTFGGTFLVSSVATGISPDGSVVVGTSVGDAFRWTDADGMIPFGTEGQAWDASEWDDSDPAGNVIVGFTQEGPTQAFRWLEALPDDGVRGLGDLLGTGLASLAFGVSADGSVVVGTNHATDPITGAKGFRAFWWNAGEDGLTGTLDDRTVALGDLPRGDFDSWAFDVSADGSIVVGRGNAAPCEPALSGRSPKNRAFAQDELDPWVVDQGLVEIVRIDLNRVAQLTSTDTTPAILRQDVETPNGCFRIEFSYRFMTTTGRLDVFLGGVQVGSLEAPSSLSTRREPARLLVNAPNLFALPDAPLQFRLHAASGGAQVLIDDVAFLIGANLWHREAFRWDPGLDGVAGTADDRMIGLGDLPGGRESSEASAISSDGTVIVGRSDSDAGVEAFRWTASEGMVGLGDLCGSDFLSNAEAVSADGSIVLGFSASGFGSEAFIWDRETDRVAGGKPFCEHPVTGETQTTTGMRSLREVLMDDFGLELGDWLLTSANGISDDGQRVVGQGISPEGSTEAWIVVLPQPLSFADADADGLANEEDNCRVVPNNQQDADSDGIGDACECGDVDGDGHVTLADADELDLCLAGGLECGPLCDVTGEGSCDETDAAAIRLFAQGQVSKLLLACPERRKRCGDANLDGVVNTTDVRLIQRCVTGNLHCEALGPCDVTGDGRCNTSDSRILQRAITGNIARELLPCVAVAPGT
jgi:probable HAF family extracellular repeat protein